MSGDRSESTAGSDIRARTDRLARLLSDVRGAEVLRELQLLAQTDRADAAPATVVPVAPLCRAPVAEDVIGVWRVEDDGCVLRRVGDAFDALFWADHEEVRLDPHAERVVLIGESVARGWVYDPEFNPAGSLQRCLDDAEPGRHQVIDMAKQGACPEELATVVDRLGVLRPDVLVIFAGNNWAGLPFEPSMEQLDRLAGATRQDGFLGLKRAFERELEDHRSRLVLDSALALHRRYGTRVVVIVPEFNLQGWSPATDVEVPVIPAERLRSWYEMRSKAVAALGAGDRSEVESLAAELRELDGGTTAVPGQLLAAVARERGDGRAVRRALEEARDSVVGLGVFATPRAPARIQQLLVDFALEHGFGLVDSRDVLADGPLALPDRLSFLDYCHLSDSAIERTMAATTDVVLGLPPGTTPPGSGISPASRALTRVMVAAQCAYHGQPMESVAPLMEAALADDPVVSGFMGALLDVLETTGPVWTHPAIEYLASVKSAREVLGPVLLASLRSDAMWTLRDALGTVLDRIPSAGPDVVDLLITADKMDRMRPDCAPRRSYRQMTSSRSTLAFALDRPTGGKVVLTYRMPAPAGEGSCAVSVNGVAIGSMLWSSRWTHGELVMPAEATRPGVNRLAVDWAVPSVDAAASWESDAALISCGEFPTVLPVFGDLFSCVLTLERA